MKPSEDVVTPFDRSLGTRAMLRQPRRAVATLFFVNGFGYGTWIAHLPVFKMRLHLADGPLGLALLGGACATLVAMPLVGTSIARVGSRPVCAGASLAASASLVLPFLAPTPLAFALTVVAIAAVYSAMDVAMNAQAVAVESRSGRAIMSSFHAVFSLGGLAGSLVSAALIARGLPIAADGGLVAVACTVLALAAVPSLLREPARPAGRAKARRASRATLGPVAAFGALAFLGLVGEGSMADWSGIYLHASLGLTAAASAAGFGAFSVAMALGRAVGDGVVERFGRARTVAGGASLAAGALAAALGLHTAWAAYLGFALVGLGLANVIPVVFSAVGRLRALPPGVGIASVSTIGYAGFVVGPPTIGFTSDALGLRVALALVVACVVGIALAAPRALRA